MKNKKTTKVLIIIISVLIPVVIAFIFFSPKLKKLAGIPEKAIVIATSGLYLRAERDAASTSLGIYPTGSEIIVVDRLTDPDWWRVKTADGQTGYMYSTYLKI